MKKGMLGMPMNLQFFAEDTGADGGNGAPADGADTAVENLQTGAETNNTDDSDNGKDGSKLYSAADVQKMITERLAREDKSREKKANEADRLKNLTDQQKLDEANSRAEKAERQLEVQQMSAQTRATLEDKKVPVTEGILNTIVTGDAETTKANVEALVDYADTLRNQVRDELAKGRTPLIGGNSVDGKEQQGAGSLGKRLAAEASKNSEKEKFSYFK